MNDELWRVQLGTGEIRTMTLDGLDRAFDEGLIDARVPVLAPGSSTWTTLGSAAGLDGGSTEETPSLSPVAISGASSPAERSSIAGSDLDRDLDLPDAFDLEPRRRRNVLIGAVPGALAVAAALVVVVSKLGAAPPADPKVTPAVQAPLAAEPIPPPPSATPEPPKDTKPALSDWQKKMLLDGDKAREDKTRAKSQNVEKVQRRKPQPKVSPGLLNGGDRFDPLNGQL